MRGVCMLQVRPSNIVGEEKWNTDRDGNELEIIIISNRVHHSTDDSDAVPIWITELQSDKYKLWK